MTNDNGQDSERVESAKGDRSSAELIDRALAKNCSGLEPGSPEYQAQWKYFDELLKLYGTEKFELYVNLREPKNRQEFWSREFHQGRMTADELGERFKQDAHRPVDLEMLRIFHEFYEARLEDLACFLQSVLAPTRRGDSASTHDLEEAAGAHLARAAEARADLWSQNLQSVFEFLEEVRIQAGLGLARTGEFEGASAHWMAQLVINRAAAAWSSCKEIARRSQTDPAYAYAASPIELFRHTWSSNIPKPQTLAEQLRQEFAHGRLILKNRSQGALPVQSGVEGRSVSVRVVSPPEFHMSEPVSVDIAIVTVLREEASAVRVLLEGVQTGRPTPSHPRNLYGWEWGWVRSPRYRQPYSVALAFIGHAGSTPSYGATLKTIERWNPTYVLLVGIAGGLARVARGDVVLSSHIYGYEYGKIDGGGFQPRPNWTHQVDNALLRSALMLADRDNSWRDRLPRAPTSGTVPRVIEGPVASGDKVLDDKRDAFVQSVLRTWQGKLVAVEMEGAGAAAAATSAREAGLNPGFLMIRGISDLPRDDSDTQAGSGRQTLERDAWKELAAAAAAEFAVHFIRHAWPVQPRSES